MVLQAQTSNTYTLGGETYQYIYGSGAASSNTADRSSGPTTQFVPDSAYVPPASVAVSQSIVCPVNQVYNNILCECVCILNYYMKDGVCLKFDPINPICGRNQVYRDKRCVCDTGYYLIGTICDVCPPYSTYNLAGLNCVCAQGYELVQGQCRLKVIVPVPPVINVPVCGLNERLVNNICTCLPNYYLIRGVCTACVAPSYYDAQLALCRPNCTTNQQLDISSLTCVCIGGFVNINGTCKTCPAYSVYNRARLTCDCITGYTFSSGMCIPETTAPRPPSTLPVPPSQCTDPNAFFINGFCVCKTGYNKVNGVCVICPSGTFYDVDLAVCRKACNANEVYNILTGVCACAPSYFLIQGVCTKCGTNATYDSATQTCVCPPGFRLNSAGNCIAGCGVNEIFSNGQCCCKVGYYPIAGICGQCAWNEIYDQGLGICRIPCGRDYIFDISLKKCVCLPNLWEMADGTCSACVLHSTYDEVTKSCVCDRGYVKSLGLCVSNCNAYEEYRNGSCVCRQGYYLIGYSCGLCPPTQVYDATYRICHIPCQNNEVWDPIIRACRCLPGYYLINGVCSTCDPKTQFYNQMSQCCDCKEGYKKTSGQGCQGKCIPICSVNEDYILNRCVCKPGFYLINNFCTQCPEGQFYDIYQRICRIKCGTNQVYNFNSGKCDCAQGYYIVNGICSQCRPDETYNEFTKTCYITPCPGVNEYYSETTQTCICRPEYVRIKGVCANCNPGQYYDSYSDRCLCKPGYAEKQGFCEAICPPGSTYINGKCICADGQPAVNGECRPAKMCPLYSSWNSKADCCICNPGYRVINGKCSSYQYCGVNGYLKYGQCYCNQDYYWILGACRRCGPNEAYNGVACECWLGYTRDANGNCIVSNFQPKCYDNERYDATLKACVCVQGTQFIRGRCEKIPTCPANAYYNSISCVCNAGYQFNSDNSRCVANPVPIPDCPSNSFFNGVGCTCNLGVFQVALNACAPCPAGTSWNGQRCEATVGPTPECAPGYVYNENVKQCEPSAPSCGDNAFFNGATCVCLDSFHWISGVCQKCAAGTAFDGSQCSPVVVPPTITCGANQIEVNGACVCNSGLYLIKSQCLACPPYTTWNGKFCQCGCDVAGWCLGQPFSVWDSKNNVCNCQAGYTRVNGICSQA